MFSNPIRPEINSDTTKLLIGLIAIFLANVTSFFSGNDITSISASYHEGGWARDFFVGFLFAITAFMLTYNGQSRIEMVLSKIAGFSALGVAIFPCGCDGHDEVIPYAHYVCAAVMFTVLLVFCYVFYRRSKGKGHAEALRRSNIYLLCGVIIIFAIGLLLIDFLTQGRLSEITPRLVFYCEKAGLVAFGVSWLVSSKVLPLLSDNYERHHPFK